jgi:hypothetical protein
MRTLRRLLSIVLLAISVLPLFSPLLALAASSDEMLAACCRRTGQHHCAEGMVMPERQAGEKRVFRAPEQMCPYRTAFVFASHHPAPALPTAEATYAAVVSHPSLHAQTESRWRVARDRSRQKRGPPPMSFL